MPLNRKMRDMKKEKKTYDYIYKVPLMKITKLGTVSIGPIIVVESQDDDFEAEIGQERRVRNLAIPELEDFPIHSLDFSCYLKHPMQSTMYSYGTPVLHHPCLYELQYVNGNTLYPALQPEDKVIYAVDSHALNEENYASLKDVTDFINNLPESPLQSEINQLTAAALVCEKTR